MVMAQIPCPFPDALPGNPLPRLAALTLALYSAPGVAFLPTGRWMPEPPAGGGTQRPKVRQSQGSLLLGQGNEPFLFGELLAVTLTTKDK